MKRFYEAVSTGPAVGGGFAILLDGRPIRTPEKSLMVAPNEKLATEIAAEWRAQGELVLPDTMPLTQLLTTCIDRVTAQRDAITTAALAYIDSDLLCYHADEPEALRIAQEAQWTPWLKWFETSFGMPLETTYALIRLDQSPILHEAVKARLAAMDLPTFTVFQAVTNVTGSIVLGLAFAAQAINHIEAWRCTLCEELFYEREHDLEKHGLDPIEEKRRNALLSDLEGAHKYLQLIG